MTSGSVRLITSATLMPLKRFRSRLAFLAAAAACSSRELSSSCCCFTGRPLLFFASVTSAVQLQHQCLLCMFYFQLSTKADAFLLLSSPLSSLLCFSCLILSCVTFRTSLLSETHHGFVEVVSQRNWRTVSTRHAGSGEPACPDGTFAAEYVMDGWERWRVLCQSALSIEDIEDVYLFVVMISGFLLVGFCSWLVYLQILKTGSVVQGPQKVPLMIFKVGKVVGTLWRFRS